MTTTADRAAPAARPAILAPFHVPALDGLRALAFLLVFVDHSVPATIPLLGRLTAVGWSGVEVFFALSGFLVTYLLLREEIREEAAGRPPRFSLLRFWGRRCLRIWPLYLLAVALAFHVLPLLPEPWSFGPHAGTPEFAERAREFVAPSWTFLLNWAVVRHGWPRTPFSLLWSVAVEEQFYVMLPIALFLVPRRFRRAALGAAALAAFAARSVRIAHGAPLLDYYVDTFMRSDCFLAGALLADVVVSRDGRPPAPPRWLVFAVPAAYVANAWAAGVGTRPVGVEILRFALLDAMAVGAIWLCLSPGVWSRALSAKPATFLGKISYGLYVWHFVLLEAVGFLLAPMKDGPHTAVFHALRAPLALGATVLVAWASYALYERPFLRLKERLHGPPASSGRVVSPGPSA